MTRYLLLIPFLFACSRKAETNGAEFMLTNQAPKAKCETMTLKGVDIALCDIPGKDTITQWVAVYQKGKIPFQPFRVVDAAEAEAREKKAAEEEAAKRNAPPAAPAVDAGVTDASK